MRRTLQLHVLRRDASLFCAPPERGEAFEIEAHGVDRLRECARGELARRGYRLRVVSFTPTGPVAYIEAAS